MIEERCCTSESRNIRRVTGLSAQDVFARDRIPALRQSPFQSRTNQIVVFSTLIKVFSACRVQTSSFTVQDGPEDRKSTRLNSSHQIISYAVFCLKKKKI